MRSELRSPTALAMLYWIPASVPLHMRSTQLALVLVAVLAIVAGAWWVAAESRSGSVHAGPEQARALEPGAELGAAEREAEAAEAARAEPVGREVLAATPAASEAVVGEQEEARLRVVGRLLRADGTPAAGGRVWAAISRLWIDVPLDVEEDGASLGGVPVWTATVDEEGRFGFEAPESGPLRLAARAAGHAPLRREGWTLRPRDERLDLGVLRLEAGVRVSGLVVDPAGAPVAGAHLLDISASVGPSARWRLPRGPRVGETGADGRFAIDELAPGPWQLLVEAEGFQVAEARGVLDRGARAEDVRIRVDFGDAIHGFLRGAEGEAREIWRVEARLARNEQGPRGDEDAETADPWDEPGGAARMRARIGEPDAQGAFAIAGLERGESYRLTVSRRGADEVWRRERQPSLVVRAGQKSVELVLEPRATLVCEVVSAADGAPIEELYVHAGSGSGRLLTEDDGAPLGKHPGGRVRYEGIPVRQNATTGSVTILAPGHRPFERKGLSFAAGQTIDLGVVRLEPASELVVRVVAAEDERPLAGVTVGLSAESREDLVEVLARADERRLARYRDLRWATTDGEGRARLTGFGSGTASLFAVLPGRVAYGPELVVVAEGGEPFVVLLERGGSVLVRVRDPDGRAVPDVRIDHLAPGVARFEESDGDDFEFDDGTQERSDAEGIVRFEGLVPGLHAFRPDDRQGRTMMVVQREGQSAPVEPPWHEVPVGDGVEAVLELEVPARGGLHGRILQGGMPLASASVRLAPKDDEGGDSYVLLPGASDPLSGATDHEGRYAFRGVRVGVYDLAVSHPERAVPGLVEVSIVPGDTLLDVLLPVVAVSGRVLDPEGRPLEGVSVRANVIDDVFNRGLGSRSTVVEDDRGSISTRWTWSGSRSVRTGPEGRYTLDGLIEGRPLTILASGDHVRPKRSERMTLAPGEERAGVDFVLEPAGALELVLETADAVGGAVRPSWFQVLARRETEEEGEAATSQGMLSSWNRVSLMKGLEPGTWTVDLVTQSREGQQTLDSRTVEVRAGRTERVVFRR